jgi:hypothetical protein
MKRVIATQFQLLRPYIFEPSSQLGLLYLLRLVPLTY